MTVNSNCVYLVNRINSELDSAASNRTTRSFRKHFNRPVYRVNWNETEMSVDSDGVVCSARYNSTTCDLVTKVCSILRSKELASTVHYVYEKAVGLHKGFNSFPTLMIE